MVAAGGSELAAQIQERAARIARLRDQVDVIAKTVRHDADPVWFFDASSGLGMGGFNSLTGFLAACSLRLSGQDVVHLVCDSAMGRCVQGTNWRQLATAMPCESCYQRKQSLVAGQSVLNLSGDQAPRPVLARAEALASFVYRDLPLGQLCLPSVRWILRRHDVNDAALRVWADFIAEGVTLVDRVQAYLEHQPLRAVVVFNGVFFPEAIVRTLAARRGVRVVAHEIGYRNDSAFFCQGVAATFPIAVPDDWHMTPENHDELDGYLQHRFAGQFKMGSADFWPAMRGIDGDLAKKCAAARRVVTVFTNVIFDTSQTFANTVFEDMFDWLEATLSTVLAERDVLCIVRAHPDEVRAGKECQQTVEAWLRTKAFASAANLHWIGPTEGTSSYELLRRSDFVIAYNSTIALEATLCGVSAITGGKTRYHEYHVTHAPASPLDYAQTVRRFIREDVPAVPQDWVDRARRYLYYSVFRASVDLSPFLAPLSGYEYTVREFAAEALAPKNSPALAQVQRVILA